jgi:antitoxin (DNA-binding transcriptional repressor) of toxin-antitoxin stability system
MKTLELAQATAPLADYARDLDKEPVVVMVRGRPVAALMPIENADRETVTLSTNPQFLALIERYAQSGASRRDHLRAMSRTAWSFYGRGCQSPQGQPQDSFGDSQRSCRGQPGDGHPPGDRLRHHA